MHVSIDRRQPRVFQVTPVSIEQGGGTNEVVLSAEDVVDHGVREQADAGLAPIHRRGARRNCARHRHAFTFRASQRGERQAPAGRGPEDAHTFPPRRDRLPTTPDSMRSDPPQYAMIIGIVVVAPFAARMAGGATTTMMSTFDATSAPREA
jgi:hypothetical protein